MRREQIGARERRGDIGRIWQWFAGCCAGAGVASRQTRVDERKVRAEVPVPVGTERAGELQPLDSCVTGVDDLVYAVDRTELLDVLPLDVVDGRLDRKSVV